jgi:hypothetical protein
MVEPMTAINHLDGKTGGSVELLGGLSTSQLAEQIEFFQERRELAATSGEAYTAWRWARNIALAERVMAKRTELPVVHD